MRKIFYKIFLYFCLAAYLPLALIYAFNFFYVDRYIIENKKKNLIEIAETIDINKLKEKRKEEIRNKDENEIYIRYINFLEKDSGSDFFRILNKSEKKFDIKNMELNEYDIQTVKLSSITNHFFLIKKISEYEIVAVIGEIIIPKVVTGIIFGMYKQYSLFIIPILLIISYIFSKKFSEPIEILEKVSYQISNSNFTETVEINSKNELGSLGNNINKMARQLQNNIKELSKLNKQLKNELLEKEKILEAEKVFMRAIGHELKTPVAIINGYIEALQDDIIEGEEIAKTYNIIYEEGMSINKLVKDINEYLKLEFKNLELCYEKIQVRGLIKDSLKKYKLDIEQKNIKLIESYEDKELNTDIKLFNIVLNNLITNAITYVDERREIDIELTDKSLIISNTSKEISEETIDKIFNPFYKIDDSRNRKYGGTGLGLSIVKNILEALNLKYSFSYDKEEKKVKFIIVF